MNLIEKLQSALVQKASEKVPAGWRTVAEIARESGKSESTTYKVIRAAVKAGLIEARDFRVVAGKRVLPVPHYREVK